ncbi:hypothetical protein G5T42_06085 [Microbacterium sp. 4R-513]|uniref:hypothetical protein n=1 Tax=Microbacterium sp. 4R-513 TaxID=2567934 RepID=UPI0013E10632|nr:hypothetical protein [Microbacterium sp. 4R-513]QIG39109.1 hypothetical protein G5T42_06085 [Microbacterium sp. 4R-513]
MQEVATLTSMVSAMWVTVAILAGGFARTRNRSPWYWFLGDLKGLNLFRAA